VRGPPVKDTLSEEHKAPCSWSSSATAEKRQESARYSSEVLSRADSKSTSRARMEYLGCR
jgi:hypothetical protein